LCSFSTTVACWKSIRPAVADATTKESIHRNGFYFYSDDGAAMMMMVTAIVSAKMVFIAIQRLAIVMAMGETFVFSRVEPEWRQTR
jgi:hypothetical protein